VPRAFGQSTPMWLQRGVCLRGHRVLLLLRTGEPVFSFWGNGAPAPILGNAIGGEDIQYLFPVPQPKHVQSLALLPRWKDYK